MATPLRVLILEDRPADAELMVVELRRGGFELDWRRVDTAEDFLAHLDPNLDVILADYRLPQWDALQALRLMQERVLDIPFIVVTGSLGDELAAECLKRGATDYVLKDRMSRLGLAVQNAIEQKGLREAQAEAERRVQESEERYRTLFQDSKDAIYVTTQEGDFVDINQSTLDLLGYTREEMLQLNAGDIYAVASDRQTFQQEIEKLGSVKDYDVKFRRMDGTELDCLLTATIRKLSDGSILGYQGIIRDITELKRAGEKIRQLNEELEIRVAERTSELGAIQSSMTDGLLVAEADGRIRYVNQAAADLTGLVPGEVVGELADIVFRVRTQESEDEDVWQQLIDITGGSVRLPATVESVILQPQRRDLVINAFPIATSSEHQMVGVLLRDVTQERDLDRRRDNFVSVASHELRTPMAVIAGYSELLLHRDLQEAVQQESLGRIHRSAQTLTAIVDDLLNVSRIHSGKLQLNPEPLDLRDVVEEVVNTIGPMSDRHEIVSDVTSDLPKVMADRDKLFQILTNLVDNAVKYSPGGGMVTVSGITQLEKARLLVAVADQGLGIAPEDHGQLFTTFNRIRRPETQGIRGSGLGLYIVKELVELLGGAVWVESELGKGSTFFIAIPTEGADRVAGS